MNVTCPDCRSIFRIDPAKVPAGGVRARCSICGGVFAVSAAGPRADAPTAAAAARADAPSSAPVAAPSVPAAARAEVTAPTVRADSEARGRAAAGAEPAERAPTAASSPAQAESTQPPPVAPAPAAADAPSIWGSPAAVPAARFDAPPMPERPSGPLPSAAAPVTAAQNVAPPTVAPPSTPPAAPAPTPAAVPTGDAAPRRPVNPYLSNDPGQKARRLARALVSDLIAYHPQKREEGLRAGTLKQLFRDEIRKSWEEYVEQVGAQVAESTPHFQDALNDLLAGGRKVF
jgi:predicted Zn finger-like uncharacterized protein